MITCSERCDSTTRRSDQWLVFIRALHLCESRVSAHGCVRVLNSVTSNAGAPDVLYVRSATVPRREMSPRGVYGRP